MSKVIFFIYLLIIKHPFHVSVTEIDCKNNNLQITQRYFLDDFDKTISEFAGKTINLKEDQKKAEMDSLVESYIRKNFFLLKDKKELFLEYIGFEVDQEGVWIYFVHKNFVGRSFSVWNQTLFEIYDDQSNIIHFHFSGNTKSHHLNRSNPEGKFFIKEKCHIVR
jgi:hypothetical protein